MRPVADPWKHDHVEANGIRFHYVTAGEGPLVLLLHGFPQFWYAWRHQIPALAKKFRVVAPDLRGYGDTDKPKGVRHYKTSILADDIAALVAAFGEKKARIAGHDWGGAVAWVTAANHADVVEKLAILNCPHPGQMRKHLLTNPRQLKKSWYMFFFQAPWLPERAILKNNASVVKPMFRGLAKNKAAFSDEDLEQFRQAMQKPGALTAALNYYRAAFRYPWAGPKHKIAAPTLVIWGENDAALGKELTFGQDSFVKGSYRIEYIPDCSHWVNEEQPQQVSELLTEFFQ
jgi:pimeloyl-ACP methyl ester carboxylesterase